MVGGLHLNSSAEVHILRFRLNISWEVLYHKHFLGFEFISLTTSFISVWDMFLKSVPLGKYLLNIPLAFSFEPLCQDE